jgi:four helix bundle protein
MDARRGSDVSGGPEAQSIRTTKLTRFEDLKVWQKAHALVLEVYRMTAGFPHEERYGLVSQMRRAAVSVPANIAEGFKKRGPRDKVNFYNIAQGSLEELRYYFILTRDLGYLPQVDEALARADQVGRMLYALVATIRSEDIDRRGAKETRP